MASLGFKRGRASPCCYYHPTRGLRRVVHGDDFVVAGSSDELAWVKGAMGDSFLTKEVGTLGDGAGEVAELRILNRVVRWCAGGLIPDMLTFSGRGSPGRPERSARRAPRAAT